MVVGRRFAPCYTAAEAEAQVRPLLDGADSVEVLQSQPGAPPNLTNPLVAEFVDGLGLPVRPKLGWTDVARFASRGVPAVNFGPGDPEIAHTAGASLVDARRRSIEPCADATLRALRRRRRDGGSARAGGVRIGSRLGVTSRRRTRDDLAVDRDVGGIEDHLVEVGVLGPEHDLVAAPEEGLHRGLLARDAGDDGVAGIGRGLLAHDHVVAVEDAGVDHGVAADPHHEELAVAGEVFGDGEGLLDVLLREHAGAGGDVADERHVAHGRRSTGAPDSAS